MRRGDDLDAVYGPVPVALPRTFSPKALIEHFEPMSLRALARRLQVDPALLCRPLSAVQADKYATRLGVHPAEVWGALWLRPAAPEHCLTIPADTATNQGEPNEH